MQYTKSHKYVLKNWKSICANVEVKGKIVNKTIYLAPWFIERQCNVGLTQYFTHFLFLLVFKNLFRIL